MKQRLRRTGRRIMGWGPDEQGLTPGRPTVMKLFRRGARKPKVPACRAATPRGRGAHGKIPSMTRASRPVPSGGPRNIRRALMVWHDVRPR